MPAYLVSQVEVKDIERFEKYPEMTLPLVERHGGRPLAISPNPEIEEGNWPGFVVLIEFPDKASIRALFSDPEYEKAKQLRHEVADSTIVIVEGLPEGESVAMPQSR